jgi:hypothetical protein
MSYAFRNLPIPAERDPAATAWGFMLDHLYAARGRNVAKPRHWDEHQVLRAEACEDPECWLGPCCPGTHIWIVMPTFKKMLQHSPALLTERDWLISDGAAA